MMIYCVFNSRFRRAALKLLGCPSFFSSRHGSVSTRLTREETTGMVRFETSQTENILHFSASFSCCHIRESTEKYGNASSMLNSDLLELIRLSIELHVSFCD